MWGKNELLKFFLSQSIFGIHFWWWAPCKCILWKLFRPNMSDLHWIVSHPISTFSFFLRVKCKAQWNILAALYCKFSGLDNSVCVWSFMWFSNNWLKDLKDFHSENSWSRKMLQSTAWIKAKNCSNCKIPNPVTVHNVFSVCVLDQILTNNKI